jgi:hypothetical protein
MKNILLESGLFLIFISSKEFYSFEETGKKRKAYETPRYFVFATSRIMVSDVYVIYLRKELPTSDTFHEYEFNDETLKSKLSYRICFT